MAPYPERTDLVSVHYLILIREKNRCLDFIGEDLIFLRMSAPICFSSSSSVVRVSQIRKPIPSWMHA